MVRNRLLQLAFALLSLLLSSAAAQTSFYQPSNAVFKNCGVVGIPGSDYPECNAIPLFDDVTPVWTANVFVTAGYQIQVVATLNPNLSQTYIFQVMTPGVTGATEPQWNNPPYPPYPIGVEVSDGGVVWTLVGGDAAMGINVGTGQTLGYRGAAICRTDNCTRTSTNNTGSTFAYGFQYTDANGAVHQANVSGNWFAFKVCSNRGCTLKAGATGTKEAGN